MYIYGYTVLANPIHGVCIWFWPTLPMMQHNQHALFQVDVPGAPFMVTMHIFCRNFFKNTVIHGVCIRFWPILSMMQHHQHASFQVDVPGAPFMVTMRILHYGSERITKRYFALWIRGHHQTSFCIMDQRASPNVILHYGSERITKRDFGCTITIHRSKWTFQVHHLLSPCIFCISDQSTSSNVI